MATRGSQNRVDQILDCVGNLVAEIERNGVASIDLDSTLTRVGNALSSLQRLNINLSCVQVVISELQRFEEVLRSESLVQVDTAYTTPWTYTGYRGRPRFQISQSQIDYLLVQLNLSVPRVAQALGVSVRTIRRRMSQYNISRRLNYSAVSDQELEYLVALLAHRYPNCGYRMMYGHIISLGIRVQQRRIREALQTVNPLGVSSRWSQHRAIHRRVYSVPHPNALWHVDGNHSLIKWGFVVHGGVDGYSRVVTFLNCALSNTAQTVSNVFINACVEFGVPSRVRSDRGGENFEIAQFMLLLRGLNRGSHITGQSTRNQRIERMWRDVFCNCLSLFYGIFNYLENVGALNIENPLHRYALHAVYQPRINHSLKSFQNAWNNHSLSSEHSCTPLQLMTLGILSCAGSDRNSIQEILNFSEVNETDNSVDEYDVREDENCGEIIIEELRQRIDPLSPSEIWGVDLYAACLQVLSDHENS